MTPLLESITLKGFLSFGPEGIEVPLSSLNVMIGPNGSGKSNLVEALSILRAAPRDLQAAATRDGSFRDLFWLGPPPARTAELGLRFASKALQTGGMAPISYQLRFGAQRKTFHVRSESLQEAGDENDWPPEPKDYILRDEDKLVLRTAEGKLRTLDLEGIDSSQSILSQRRDPDSYPQLARVASALLAIRIYRNHEFGPSSNLRASCRADVRTDFLEENFENLPARLAALKRSPSIKRKLLELLNELAPGFDDLEIIPEGGALQLYLMEGERSIPSQRLSDGTLRYLCLLATLLDPGPTSLLVLEEPELGLHPDVVVSVTNLMIERSSKTQLLVTTHSSQMLDALTDHADSVLVCEKPHQETTISRLQQADIDALKDRGGLGWLWMRGHLGGTRW